MFPALLVALASLVQSPARVELVESWPSGTTLDHDATSGW